MHTRKPMAAKTGRYARKKNVQKKSAVKPPSRLPFGQVMQNLLPLVGLMRNMSLEGGPTARNPKLILTGSGLELCFSAADTPSTQSAQPPDRLAEMERSLKLLTTTVNSLAARCQIERGDAGSPGGLPHRDRRSLLRPIRTGTGTKKPRLLIANPLWAKLAALLRSIRVNRAHCRSAAGNSTP